MVTGLEVRLSVVISTYQTPQNLGVLSRRCYRLCGLLQDSYSLQIRECLRDSGAIIDSHTAQVLVLLFPMG